MRRFTLGRVVRSLVTPASDAVQRVTEPDPVWTTWAASHGFTYRFDGSAFEGGRVFEPVPDRHGSGEQCFGVVEGTWRDHPFTIVQRKRWDVGGRMGRRPGFSTALLLQLPGTPVPALLAMTPAAAFAAAGGELPTGGDFEWRPPDLLLGLIGRNDPTDVGGILERITLQLAAAPAELWQS